MASFCKIADRRSLYNLLTIPQIDCGSRILFPRLPHGVKSDLRKYLYIVLSKLPPPHTFKTFLLVFPWNSIAMELLNSQHLILIPVPVWSLWERGNFQGGVEGGDICCLGLISCCYFYMEKEKVMAILNSSMWNDQKVTIPMMLDVSRFVSFGEWFIGGNIPELCYILRSKSTFCPIFSYNLSLWSPSSVHPNLFGTLLPSGTHTDI